jgi:hypothetical protein
MHTGGHSAEFALCTLMHDIDDPELRRKTLAAAAAFGAPFNVIFSGVDEGATLTAAVERRKILCLGTEIGGWGRVSVEALRIDIDRAKPEMPIIIDRAKARLLNVSTYAVADAIRTALFGKEVSTFRIEGDDDDYKIMVRLQDDQRYDVGTIMNMNITFRDMLNGQIRQVPISAVAKEELSSTFSAIKRTDQKRVVTVSSKPRARNAGMPVNTDSAPDVTAAATNARWTMATFAARPRRRSLQARARRRHWRGPRCLPRQAPPRRHCPPAPGNLRPH